MGPPSSRKDRKFAEGPMPARVMLIGQNPGREEVRQGRPFVGRAGRYLDRVLRQKGLDREALYLTSLVKEPTPGNRKPSADEIRRWIPVLIREIREVAPEIIVLMGRVAWQAPRLEGVEYLETDHPAAAMRFPEVRRKFEKDLEYLSDRLKGKGPPTSYEK